MNGTILRPNDLAQPLNELQKAEELIKKEMLVMLHFDAMYTPTASQCGLNSKKQTTFIPQPLNYDKHKSFLNENKYDNFSVDEMANVKWLFFPCSVSIFKLYLMFITIVN
jgi:pre-mRNA-splicing factor CDC5/CEF1